MAAAAMQQQEAALPDDPARTLQRRDSSHLPQVMADLLPVTVFGGKSLVICLLMSEVYELTCAPEGQLHKRRLWLVVPPISSL